MTDAPIDEEVEWVCISDGTTYYRARGWPGYMQASARFAAHVQQASCAILAEKYERIFGLLGLVTGYLVGGSGGEVNRGCRVEKDWMWTVTMVQDDR